ncbi:MAG: nucleotidyltransferase family protein [Acidobacteria bacterium]|nr:nucleotidyltransferase family protein [Acidobacteriota bacterium]MCA1627494.1 nucleotidyltransferase family protein [Acidobacteriota bacterium]
MTGYQREDELLLCCARTEASPELAARIRALAAADVDWNYLALLARRHSITPLLYRQLQRHASELVPSAYLAKLKLHYQENSARNTILTAELRKLIEIFRAAGIEAIPYKGPALALFAYDNLALRRFVDLDIIVKKSDVPRARDLLLAEDYEPTKSLTAAQQDLLLRTQHNLQFALDDRRLLLELHWEVAPHLFASSVQENELWKNLITIDVNGTLMKTLSADDLLFSLCVHGSRHLWERLGWICDVAELIRRHELNWPALLRRALETDSERMFLLGLHLAQKLLHAELPAEVKQRCAADARLQSLAANVVEHLFNGPTHVPATSTEIFKYNIGVRKSLAARARYFVHMLRPTDGDFGAHSLPARLSFAYYLVRPFRLLFKTKTT